MGLLRGLALASTLAVLVATPVWAQEDAAASCDTLAASPNDPGTPAGAGVMFGDVDGAAALEACLDASKAAPDNAKLRAQLGRAYDVLGNAEKAVEQYEIAIDLGSDFARLALGQLYEGGYGVAKDEAKAAQLYEQAAQAGIVRAMEDLGKLYEDGRGVEQDYERARALYQEAIDAGSSWGAASLGWMTENGWGVKQDDGEARRLYEIAAADNVDFALNNLGSFYLDGRGGLAVDVAKGIEYYERAAEAGYARSFVNLARQYSDGQAIERDPVKAEEYLREAIASDEPDQVAAASNNLAWLFANEEIKLDEAERLVRSALEFEPENADWLDTLGFVLHKLGRNEEALPIMEKAAALAPEQTAIQERLELVRAALD